MLVVNIGGEGEVLGAVNVNSLVFPLRRLEEIRRGGPLIQGDLGERVLVPYLEAAGFTGVRLVANHAIGVRP